MVRRHGPEIDRRSHPFDADAVHASGGGKAHGRYTLFDGMIDSMQLRSQGSGSSSPSSTSSRRPTEQELELARMREELRQRDEQQREELRRFNEQQKAQQDYFNAFIQAQQAALQATFQQQGLNIVLPAFQPPPLIAPAPAPPLPVPGLGMHGSQFVTPPAQLRAPGDQDTPAAGSGTQQAAGADFVEALFAYPHPGGSSHSSNHPSGGFGA